MAVQAADYNGLMWIMRTGAPWCYPSPDYGKWNSVYVRFRRWAEMGVWEAILETLVELGRTDDWAHMMDSPTVCAHAQAAGEKGDSFKCSWSKPRRFFDKDPRPVRRQERGFILSVHHKGSLSRHRRTVKIAGQQTENHVGGQRLR
ncbi:MAG: transposase [Rhodomicrobiaceae bacterium]